MNRWSVAIASLVFAASCVYQPEPAEVGRTRQELGITWTQWSQNVAFSGEPGTGGKRSGRYVYTANDGGLADYGVKTANSTPSAASVSLRTAPGVTSTIDANGCELVVFRNGAGSLTWFVESWNGTTCVPASGTNESGAIDSAAAAASYLSGSNQNYWVFAGKNSGNCSGGLCVQWNRYTGTTPTNGSFSGWTERTDGTMKSGSAPAAISGATDRVDLFVRGTGDGLWWQTLTVSGGTPSWNSWSSLGGSITSDPSVGTRDGGNLDVCARGGNNAAWCRTYDFGSWSDWRDCGGELTSKPIVTTDGTDVWVMGRGVDGTLYARSCNP